MKTYVVKFGGSVITDKKKDQRAVNTRKLKQLCSEVSNVLNKEDVKVVIVHGAGPYGHVPAKKYKLKQGLRSEMQVRGVSETRNSMGKLNAKVVDALVKEGVNAVAFQPSACGILKRGRIVEFQVKALKKLVDAGLTPVLYGDVLVDLEKGVDILSGDQLVPYLAEKLCADKVVIVTSYNGVFDKDPCLKDARKYDLIDSEIMRGLKGRKTDGTDVTGGIVGKISELLAIARKGIPSEIIGSDRGYLRRTLSGESGIGTAIKR
ncbi:MAG: isopentenyl phosphate kinase family protein [Candidatus Altiarchaeota archaeon]|nr:isopentenyl phosphate kinase family protein [Candidatus Altiarchaeota archaeon]